MLGVGREEKRVPCRDQCVQRPRVEGQPGTQRNGRKFTGAREDQGVAREQARARSRA